MDTGRHRILIVEDNPENARGLREDVESMRFEARVATTLDEARAIFAEWAPCGVLQDMQIPHAAGARPHDKAGESNIKLIREASRGPRRVVVIVVTAFRSDPDFVWRMADLEADGFVEKTRLEAMPDKLTAALAKNGRADHADCARCNAESAVGAAGAASAAPVATETRDAAVAGDARVVITVDGAKNKRRTGFLVNGRRTDLQDAKFVHFLRLVVAHLRTPGSYVSTTALGMTTNKWVVIRIREAFKGLLPPKFAIIEEGGRMFRLNPSVVIERVEWSVLAGHPEVQVQKMAREMAGR